MGFLWFGKKKKSEKSVMAEPIVREEKVPVETTNEAAMPKEEEKPVVKDEPKEAEPMVKDEPKEVKPKTTKAPSREKTASQTPKAKTADTTEKKTLMGKFFVRKTDNDRYVFSLRASNGENIATSGAYTSKSNLETGIASMAKNAPIANVEDQTLVKVTEVSNPKFEIYLDKANEYRFRLKARNGEIIAVSQGYSGKAACKNGIASVRKNAAAPVVYED